MDARGCRSWVGRTRWVEIAMKPPGVGQTNLAEPSDADLVRRFADERDHCAFACLVERHSRLVLGACQRMLKNRQDAQDAFQAAFLTLARRIRSVRKVESLAGWLYGVAVRVSLNVRRANRQWSEAVQRAEKNHSDAATQPADPHATEALAALDEELARLPARYRDVLVLCELDGQTQKAAAHQLGVSAAAVSSRAIRGRKLLREALVRRGITVGASGLVWALSQAAQTSSQASAELIHGTATSAIHFLAGKTASAGGASLRVTGLVNELMRTLMFAKLKLTVCVVSIATAIGVVSPSLSSVLGLGGGVAKGQTIFFDDFEDGSITNSVPVTLTDGQPVTWQGERTSLQIQDGSLIISGSSVPLAVPSIGTLSDVSIQVQLRVLAGDGAGIGGRRTLGFPVTNYHAYIGTNEVGIAYGPNGTPILHSTQVDFDAKLEDVILQLDIIGNSITYWAWPADEPRPAQPLGSVVDDTLTSGSLFFAGAGDAFGTTAFRYVHVATAAIPVPEPSTVALTAIAPLVFGFWWLRRRG